MAEYDMDDVLSSDKENVKSTTKKEKDKEKDKEKQEKEVRKSQRVKVLVSVYRYGDKIVSALGIPKRDAVVSHHLNKSKLTPDEMFDILVTLRNSDTFRKDESYRRTIDCISDDNQNFIIFPDKKTYELKNFGKLYHEILNIEIELFIK